MTAITKETLPALFDSVAQMMSEHADILCEMDAKLGDGDLGLTMKKGFGALPDLLRTIDEPDIGRLLAKAGMKMSSVVPSTMGTLMASGIMSGGKALTGVTTIGATEFADFLSAFAAGVQKRGKCAPGDRTVLDALLPAAECAQAAAAAPDASLATVADAAVRGATQGVEQTCSMKPKFGKAAVFSDRCAGTPDQGAVAGRLMVMGLAAFICGTSVGGAQ